MKHAQEQKESKATNITISNIAVLSPHAV